MGATSEVEVPYEAPKAPRAVRVRGTMRLAKAWGRERLYVNLTRLGSSVAADKHTRRTLKAGDAVELELSLEDGQSIQVELTVKQGEAQ